MGVNSAQTHTLICHHRINSFYSQIKMLFSTTLSVTDRPTDHYHPGGGGLDRFRTQSYCRKKDCACIGVQNKPLCTAERTFVHLFYPIPFLLDLPTLTLSFVLVSLFSSGRLLSDHSSSAQRLLLFADHLPNYSVSYSNRHPTPLHPAVWAPAT